MERKSFYIPEEQLNELLTFSKEDGISVSEHIRQAIQDYIERRQPRVTRSPSKYGSIVRQ